VKSWFAWHTVHISFSFLSWPFSDHSLGQATNVSCPPLAVTLKLVVSCSVLQCTQCIVVWCLSHVCYWSSVSCPPLAGTLISSDVPGQFLESSVTKSGFVPQRKKEKWGLESLSVLVGPCTSRLLVVRIQLSKFLFSTGKLGIFWYSVVFRFLQTHWKPWCWNT